MKAISLIQPWASLIAVGAKKIETRSWATQYRGPIAIHASARIPPEARRFSESELCQKYLKGLELPLGKIVAVAELVTVRRMNEVAPPSDVERSFGDWSDERFAWFLKDVMALETPVAAKGKLSVWDWDELGLIEGME